MNHFCKYKYYTFFVKLYFLRKRGNDLEGVGSTDYFILIGRVVVKIQIMRAALDFLQLRVAGKEQDAGAALFIFCHGMSRNASFPK